MLNNNIFNSKRFTRLVKVNWMLSRARYLNFMLTMFVVLALMMFFFTMISKGKENDQLVYINVYVQYSFIYNFVMIFFLLFAGMNSFRDLFDVRQPIQAQLPASVFERYLIAVFEFIFILIFGFILLVVYSLVWEKILYKWHWVSTATFEISKFDITQIFENGQQFVRKFLIFATVYFMAVLFSLSSKRNKVWRTTTSFIGIILLAFIVYLLTDSQISITNETESFDNTKLQFVYWKIILPIILFGSICLSYIKLKKTEWI